MLKFIFPLLLLSSVAIAQEAQKPPQEATKLSEAVCGPTEAGHDLLEQHGFYSLFRGDQGDASSPTTVEIWFSNDTHQIVFVTFDTPKEKDADPEKICIAGRIDKVGLSPESMKRLFRNLAGVAV